MVNPTAVTSAFELLYGRECLLSVELMIESWQTVDWEAIGSREDLILARIQQLDNRRVTETIAICNQPPKITKKQQGLF